MKKLLLDPCILALPHCESDADDCDGFIRGLLNWQETALTNDVPVFLLSEFIDSLFQANAYPYENRIDAVLRKVPEFGSLKEDIKAVARTLVGRSCSLLEFADGCEIALNQDQTSINPVEFATRCGDILEGTIKNSLGTISLSQKVLCAQDREIWIASKTLACQSNEVSVSARAEIVELNGSIVTELSDSSVEAVFPLVFCHEDLENLIGALGHWQCANSESGAYKAIEWYVQDLVRVGAALGKTPYSFKIGKSFLESVKRWGFATSGMTRILLENCAKIVLQIKVGEPFRENSKATALQKIREDGYKAFRLHLTSRGPGYRLMYWQKGNDLEFANVGDKDELLLL